MTYLHFLKKQAIRLLLLVLLFALLVSNNFIAYAKPTQTSGNTGDVTWSYNDGHLVFSGNGTTEDLNFYSVGDWYRWGRDIKKVTFEEGITRIGAYLFYDDVLYKNIKSVHIPTTVKEIGECAFTMLSALESVHIKNLSRWCSITFEGSGAVGNPLDQRADLYLKGNIVEDLVIPSDVTEICDFAFKGCQSIKKVTLHSGVKKVGSFAFNTCSNLEEMYFIGNAPTFGKAVFTLSSLTAYYPKGNKTWTDKVLKGYGGNITWKTHILVKSETSTTSSKTSTNKSTTTSQAPTKKTNTTTSVEKKASSEVYIATSSKAVSTTSTDNIADSVKDSTSQDFTSHISSIATSSKEENSSSVSTIGEAPDFGLFGGIITAMLALLIIVVVVVKIIKKR